MNRFLSRNATTVALDFRWLDRLQINGQHRYCIELITGLAELKTECQFVVIGSQDLPPESIRGVFEDPRWRYAPLPPWRHKGASYVYHLRYAALLRRERVDLLHCLHSFVPLLSRLPRVVTVYDLMVELFPEYEQTLRSRSYRLSRFAARNAAALMIAISQTTANDIRRLWNVPESRIAVVPLSVAPRIRDTSRAATPRGDDGPPLILSPFNLEPRKNLLSLVKAIALLRDSGVDARLVLYGRAAVTPERERQFQAEVRNLGVQDAVTLTGVVSDEDLSGLYRQATLFVFPSVYEGFGLPVVEAMAMGLCTVAGNQSAMAEVLGDAGVQVDTTDSSQLAGAIIALLVNPTRRSALGRAARQRSARFTRQAMARATFAAYQSALRTAPRT